MEVVRMGAGDVWEVATCVRDVGHVKPGSEVITWGVQALSDYSDVHDLAVAWRAAVPHLMAVLADGAAAEGAFYRRWLPTEGSRIGIKFATAVVGGVSAQELPAATAALVLRQSGLQGRNVWGRVYVPWLPVQYEDPFVPNQIVEIDRLAIEQACKDVDSALQAGGTGTTWRTVTISRRSLQTPGIYATPVTRFTCMRDFRALAQRNRRHYVCPFEELWLTVSPFNFFARRRGTSGNWLNAGSNPLSWRYWLNGGARGGDDGSVDPNWILPTFTPTGWHPWLVSISPGKRLCGSPIGPGGVIWPPLLPNAHDPPAYESCSWLHYGRTGGGVPNSGNPLMNNGEQDYYRTNFKVTNIPVPRTAVLRANHLDGVAHWINGTQVINYLGGYDSSPPACRTGDEIDILPLLNLAGAENSWAILHQPRGEMGTSARQWIRYNDHQPPVSDAIDSWWAGEIRIGGTFD
jgi:hypothetical protein